jgi:hypothetical protein
MQTTEREFLIRAKPFIKNVTVHEDDLEGIMLMVAMESALYASSFCKVTSLSGILEVMEFVTGLKVTPNMLIYAMKLTQTDSEPEQTDRGNLNVALASVRIYADMARLAMNLAAQDLPPGGPFARALRVHQSLIVSGELSAFKEMYEKGPTCLLEEPVKAYLNSKNLIHHFEHYFV